jgi:hypothetical protein
MKILHLSTRPARFIKDRQCDLFYVSYYYINFFYLSQQCQLFPEKFSQHSEQHLSIILRYPLKYR